MSNSNDTMNDRLAELKRGAPQAIDMDDSACTYSFVDMNNELS